MFYPVLQFQLTNTHKGKNINSPAEIVITVPEAVLGTQKVLPHAEYCCCARLTLAQNDISALYLLGM